MGDRNPQETDMAKKNPSDNPQPTSVDPEPKEFDNKTQHGEQSDARKGSQPGLTGHSDRSGKDTNEGRPLAPK
jgi:hypothetical protein